MTRFCVLATQRSGSTWFVDLLNLQDGIRTFSEVFRQGEIRDPNAFYEKRLNPPERFVDYRKRTGARRPFVTGSYLRLLDSFAPDCDALGFKLMYNHVWALPELMPLLATGRYRVLHLVRRDRLALVVSRLRRRQTGTAHSDKSSMDRRPVRLDVAEVLALLDQADAQARKARLFRLLMPLRKIIVYYEDLAQDTEHEIRRSLQFLGIESGSIRSDSALRKMRPAQLQEYVLNYDELASAVRASRHAHCLEN